MRIKQLLESASVGGMSTGGTVATVPSKTGKMQRRQGNLLAAEGNHPKTWHDVDKKLGKATDKMSQAEKVKKGLAHPDTLKKKGVAEGLPQTLRKVVPGYAKREIDKKMDAGKFGKTDADKDANFQRYKKIQDKLKEQGVAESTPKDPKAPKQVQDRKTGKWYNPQKEFEKKMNSPEVQAQMKRMAQKEGVAEGTDGWIGNPSKWKEAVLQAHGPDIVFKNYSHPGQPGKRSVNAWDANGKIVGVYQRHNKMGMVQPNMQGVAEGELDEACWKDYKQIGMKKKGGKSVPNCVPKESVDEDTIEENKKGVRAVKHTTKPRNFVAKNAAATTSGAGAHKDKKKAMKQGEVKHKGKEPAYESKLWLALERKIIK